MANKFLKRTLSVVMCAAMLVSVFAVSFTVSATVTQDTNETIYDWDYENDSTKAHSETLANSVIKSQYSDDNENSKAKVSVGNNQYLSINRTQYIKDNAGGVAVFFKTPENQTPKTFTVESSQYYIDGRKQDFAGGALIAKYTTTNNIECAVSFYAYTTNYENTIGNESQNAKLCLGLRKYEKGGWDNNFGPKFIQSGELCPLVYNDNDKTNNHDELRAILLNPETNEPVIDSDYQNNKTGQGYYANESIWGEKGNTAAIPAAEVGNFRYTYHITYTDKGVEVYVTAKYGDLSVDTAIYKILYEDLEKRIGNCASIEPMCGLSSVYITSLSSEEKSAKIYKAKAVYGPSSRTIAPEINASANVVLDEGIKLKITASGKDIYKKTLALTVDNNKVALGSDGSAVITKYAHQMTDKMVIKLTATGYDGKTYEKYIGNEGESGYSIADNLENLYNNSGYDSFKPLIAKLANYGAAAQAYDKLANGTEYSKMANDFMDASDTNKTTSSTAYEVFKDCAASGSFRTTEEGNVFTGSDYKVGLSLALQGEIKMAVFVSGITPEDGQTLCVRMDETDYELTNSNGIYTTVFGIFSPKEYKTTKNIQLVLKNSDGTEAATSGTAGYSVGAYINRMAQKNVTAELKTLLNALAEYQVEFAKMYNA